MEERISRKRFLSDAIKYLTGAAASLTGFNRITPGKSLAGTKTEPLPWPYARLEPEVTRKLAHDLFYDSGCGYAGFAGILKGLQEKEGEPFTSLPLEMMNYSGSGIKGWGTICGVLNGASAAISLVTDSRMSGQLINELMGWYTQTLLPSDISNRYAEGHGYKVDKNIKALPRNKSGSPLCHISITKWCIASGLSVDSTERLERCARLSGDVAAQAVKLLNDQAQNKFRAEFVMLQSTTGCLSCHGSKGESKNVATKLDCLQYHKDHRK
jgi:cytochrome c553